MEISKIIKEKRTEFGLTLKQIADRVGVSEATVQRWESGAITNLKYKRLIKLAEVLQTTPAHLMGWDKDISAYKNGHYYPMPVIEANEQQSKEDMKLLEVYHIAKKSGDPVLEALIDAIDKRIAETAHKDE